MQQVLADCTPGSASNCLHNTNSWTYEASGKRKPLCLEYKAVILRWVLKESEQSVGFTSILSSFGE